MLFYTFKVALRSFLNLLAEPDSQLFFYMNLAQSK